MKFSTGRALSDLGRELGMKWRALLLALILPAIAMSLLEVAAHSSGFPLSLGFLVSLGFLAVDLVVYALFAVTCHRIVLLGESNIPNRFGVYLDRRVWRYFFYYVTIGMIFIVGFIAATMMTMPFFVLGSEVSDGAGPAGSRGALVIAAAAGLLFAYPSVRLSMVLPDRAIDGKRPWEELFQMSRGNGWRLVAAVLIPPLLIAIPAWLARPVFEASRGLSAAIPNTLLVLVSAAVGVMAVSCAYRELLRIQPKTRTDAGLENVADSEPR